MLISDSGIGATPKVYSIEGCNYCDSIVKGNQYRGKLREYRTDGGHTIPIKDEGSGLRLSRTMDFFTETGEIFRGGEIGHSGHFHNAITSAHNLISFTVVSTGMKRYVLIQENYIAKSIDTPDCQ